uniref:Putative ubiquitin/40s ribosomal protein s27a fusion n=1 Tax=Anopheles braziliensis TaxID=58242 RepID=A0A2M3ZMK6_9DIPT
MYRLLQLLLRAQVVGVATLLLTAVCRSRVQTSIALATDHLVAVVLLSQDTERRLDDTTTQSQHEMQGRLLLDVVVRKGTAILQLLAGEDQTLLIRRDALLVLDLRLHILDGVRWLDLERDGLAGERFHENLHFANNVSVR